MNSKIFGFIDFKYAIQKFQGSQGNCHGNQIQTKVRQNCTNFSSVQEIVDFFACIVEFTGLMNSMLPEFSREPRELPWQTNFGKISRNCTNFNFVQEIEECFACIVGSTRLMNLHMLSEFSRQAREVLSQQLPCLLATPQTLLCMRNILGFLHRIAICAILYYFCLNLVAVATPQLPSLKYQIAHLNSPTPKTLLFVRKIPRLFAQN